MNEHCKTAGVVLKPREYLRQAASLAKRFRKMLRDAESRSSDSGRSRLMDDAVKLAVLVERLSEHGQRLDAEKAIEVAELVEIQIDVLVAKLDVLFTS